MAIILDWLSHGVEFLKANFDVDISIHTWTSKRMTYYIWYNSILDDKLFYPLAWRSSSRQHTNIFFLSDWHSGQETMCGVFKLDFATYESSRKFETGVLHRTSSRIYLAEWFGLGSHFGRKSPNVRESHNFEKQPCLKKWKSVCVWQSIKFITAKHIYYH